MTSSCALAAPYPYTPPPASIVPPSNFKNRRRLNCGRFPAGFDGEVLGVAALFEWESNAIRPRRPLPSPYIGDLPVQIRTEFLPPGRKDIRNGEAIGCTVNLPSTHGRTGS